MNKYIFFLLLPLCLLYLNCSNQVPLKKGQSIKTNICIKNNTEVWKGNNIIFRGGPHEGLSNPILSPNRKWLILKVTYPFDGLGSRVEQFYIVVNLDNGKRINQYELGKNIISLNWIKTQKQTLLVSYTDSEEEINLENYLVK